MLGKREVSAQAAMGLLGDAQCSCGSSLLPGKGGSVWCVAGCSWRCGSGLDLLASRLGSYAKACEAATQIEPWIASDVGMAAREEAERALTEFVWECAAPPQTMEHIQVRESFHSTCGSRLRGALHLTKKQVSRLTLLMLEAGVAAPPGMYGSGGSGVPFWSSPHRVAAISYIPTGGKSKMVITLRETRFAWSNLHQAARDAGSADLYPDFSDTGPYQELYHTTITDRVPISAVCSPLFNEQAMTWDDLRFCCPTGEWNKFLPAWSHIPGFESADFMLHPLEESRPLETIIDGMLRQDAKEAIKTLASMKLSDEFRSSLLAWHRNSPFGLDLEEKLSRVLLEIDEGVGIYRTLQGYETERGNDIKQVSNFTIDLRGIIGFDRTSEVAYDMVIRNASRELRLVIPGKSMETGTSLEAAIRANQITAGESDSIATVKDAKGMNRVMRYLRVSAASIPRIRGFRSLGWTSRHDAFVMPDRVVGELGVSTAVYAPPTDSDFHPFTALPEAAEGEGEIGPHTAELVSALIGSFVRGFLGRGMLLVPVQNNERHRTLLNDLFRELGQTQALRLTSVLQKHLDSIRGYPVLVQNLTEQQGRAARVCGVRLAEQGRSLDDGGKAAGALLRDILQEVAGELLRGAETGYRERRSVSVENSMALEGQELMRRFRPDWPLAGERWRTVDGFLETREKEIERYAKVRFTDDTVILPFEILDGIDIDDLTIEMGLLCRDVKVEDKQMLIGRNALFPVFEDFYGEAPRLSVIGG